MKMITITTTTGGGSSEQSRPLLQETDATITIDTSRVVHVKISASGQVELVKAVIDGDNRVLYTRS